MDNLNVYQMKILNILIFKKEGRFSELNVGIDSDQFNYHLKMLVKLGLVSKNVNDQYSLTQKGKEYCNGIDVYSSKIEKQPKTILTALCVKNDHGIEKYLIHQKKKHPYYDYYGFPGGKAKFGESLSLGVLRELEEETGLTGDPKIFEIKQLQHTLPKSQEIVSDGIYYCFKIDNLRGKLINTKEGENYWMSLDEIKKTPKVFIDIFETIEVYKSKKLSYIERLDEYEDY